MEEWGRRSRNAARLAAALAASALALVSTAAHADAADPGRTEAFTYGSGPLRNSYIVYTPTTYRPGRPAPLLVMVHGCQTTAEQQMRANLYNQLAEREGFIVLYPDLDPTGQLQPGPLRQCWRFPIPTSQHRGQGDAAALAGMTRAVMNGGWNVDPERVYMMGMSAGGFMTSIMAAAYPDLYAAVGIMAAGAYADGLCIAGNPAALPVDVSARLAFEEMGPRARIVPRLVMGGSADLGITPACADKAFEQGMRTNNLVLGGAQDGPISLAPAATSDAAVPGGYPYTVRTYRDPSGCLIGERWLIHGMDHSWSGGSADPQFKSWTDPKGPSGAEASWAFFSRFTKSDTAMPCAETPPCAVRIRLPLRNGERVRRVRTWVDGTRVRARFNHGRLKVKVQPPVVVRVRAKTDGGRTIKLRRAVGSCGR